MGYDPPEPPEYGCCYLELEAPNAKAAIIMAVKNKEFEKWVDEKRSDHQPPFKGLKARRTVCEHGVCWNCNLDKSEYGGCTQCWEKFMEDTNG